MQRRTRDNTNPQSQYCGTAPYSLRSRQRRQCTPNTCIVRRAYEATMLHIFAGPTRTAAHMPTSAALPATITQHTRAHRHTRRDKPHPAQRHGSIMAHVTHTPTSHAPHIAHQRTAYKHTSPARPHDVPYSRNHCALPEHHCTHTAARTPHTARHTALTTPHTANRKSHPVTHAASAPHSL